MFVKGAGALDEGVDVFLLFGGMDPAHANVKDPSAADVGDLALESFRQEGALGQDAAKSYAGIKVLVGHLRLQLEDEICERAGVQVKDLRGGRQVDFSVDDLHAVIGRYLGGRRWPRLPPALQRLAVEERGPALVAQADLKGAEFGPGRKEGLSLSQLRSRRNLVLLAKLRQFALHVLEDPGIFRAGVDRPHLRGVFREVEELPFVDVVEVHQLVAAVADAVVSADGVVLGEAIVVVVDRLPPAFGAFSFE